MNKAYYQSSVRQFLSDTTDTVIGCLNKILEFDREIDQEVAWETEIRVIKESLSGQMEWLPGHVLFEYSIPRLCGRLDVVLLLGRTVFAIEFKVGERRYPEEAKKQVLEYCLDLKYFHKASESLRIVPVLVCTNALRDYHPRKPIWGKIEGIECCRGVEGLRNVLKRWVDKDEPQLSLEEWANSKYSPTPTIIEAAIALYEQHDVRDITRTSDDEKATNLTKTTAAIKAIIEEAKATKSKKICFVTGVPGAGKTLVGLNLATDRNVNKELGTNAVFLSGNDPLVSVLQHALQKDAQRRKRLISRLLKENGEKEPPPEVKHYFTFALKKTFVQGVYGFRKNYLEGGGSDCKIAIFDEAQRCWTKKKMVRKLKRDVPSESACLIGQINKNKDWAVIVCLVGSGQEIHDGESGIVEWFRALNDQFNNWDVYVSDVLRKDPESFDVDLPNIDDKVRYQLDALINRGKFHAVPELHLGVSLRSFRSEKVSAFANAVVENHMEEAKRLLPEVTKDYPIVMTRNLETAKKWVRNKSKRIDNLYLERFGAVASSGASRIRPEGITVPGLEMNVPKWMLGSEYDVDSSYFLELAASEFKIQGLEIDYALMVWEADFRHDGQDFCCAKFKASKWQNVRNKTLQNYLKNAYRVLLTRARQGYVIYVPLGDSDDLTRVPPNYAGTYRYLKDIGIREIGDTGDLT